MRNAALNQSEQLIYQAYIERSGKNAASKWLETYLANKPSSMEASDSTTRSQPVAQPDIFLEPAETALEPPALHLSHVQATQLLEPHREALGAAYKSLHFIARCSLEYATDDDPAPHLMTCYWTLEEALGLSGKTVWRHLIDKDQAWSETVAKFIDVRQNFGKWLDGWDKLGNDKYRPCITSMVIRFFPKTRLSPNARVKRWGERDLLEESDAGRTRPTRPKVEKRRYGRLTPQMSVYRSVKEKSQEKNWLIAKLGLTVSAQPKKQDLGSIYTDIPNSVVLDALTGDLHIAVEKARVRGASVRRARSVWVDTSAQFLAARFGDAKPLDRHIHKRHVTRADGFTDLWRRALWTALKAELYGGTNRGWILINHVIEAVEEGKRLGLKNPNAYAWAQVREELEALRRDFGGGVAGCLQV